MENKPLKYENHSDLVLKRIKIRKAKNRLVRFIRHNNKKYRVNWHHKIICDEIDDFLEDPNRSRLMIFIGPRQGKALALDTPVLTYNSGWKTIGTLKIGDKVFGDDGKPCNVVAKSQIFKNRKCATLLVNPKGNKFQEKIIADYEHEWKVRLSRKKPVLELLTTKEILDKKDPKRNVRIKVANPLNLKNKKLPIDPWVLGYWLGNGNSYSANATTDRRDFPFIKNKFLSLGYNLKNIKTENNATIYTIEGLHKHLVELKLINNKHIPLKYMFSSMNQRSSLLQGLIDSDGYIDKKYGAIEISSSYKNLSNDILDLVRSLGIKASGHETISGYKKDGVYKKCKNRKRISFYCDSDSVLERKKYYSSGGLFSDNYVDFIDDETICDTQCIEVDSYNHMFLVGKTLLPTHNSEIVSRNLPAYIFGKKPESKIIGASYAIELAEHNSRDVQKIMESSTYNELFPKVKLGAQEVKRKRKGVVRPLKTSQVFDVLNEVEENGDIVDKISGQYRAAGVGSALTGFGADYLILDDLIKNWEEALSPNRLELVYNWYLSTANTRLSKNGKIIIINTRWAEGDLCGRLLKEAKINPEADQWEVLCFPTIYEKGHEHASIHDPRKEGEVLWPEFFPEDKVKKARATLGSKIWSALHQQRPAPAEGSIYKTSWFQYFKEPPKFEYTAMSIDATFKDTKESDNVAMGVFGFAGANKYLLHLVREKLDFVETIKKIIELRNRFRELRYVLVEDKANGPAVVSTLKNKIPGLITYTPTESKIARANAVSAQFEAGNLWLPDKYYEPNRLRYPWIVENTTDGNLFELFLEEFKTFPYGVNDDCVDMVNQILLKTGDVPTWLQELLDKEKQATSNVDYEKEREQAKINAVAELMGWNIQG
jgi:predicted phage terminase large subunit-like protein